MAFAVRFCSQATNQLRADRHILAPQATPAALINGERDSTVLAALTRGRLHATQDELQEALSGRFTEHHSFLLQQLLAQVDFLAARITECDQRIEVLCRPFAQKIDRLKRMAGVGQRAAEQVVSELGWTWDSSRAIATPPLGPASVRVITRARAKEKAARPAKVIAGCVVC